MWPPRDLLDDIYIYMNNTNMTCGAHVCNTIAYKLIYCRCYQICIFEISRDSTGVMNMIYQSSFRPCWYEITHRSVKVFPYWCCINAFSLILTSRQIEICFHLNMKCRGTGLWVNSAHHFYLFMDSASCKIDKSWNKGRKVDENKIDDFHVM